MRALISSLALAAILSGCSHTDKLIVTGEALSTAGDQFLIVARAMDEAAISGTITEAQYQEWAKFGKKFQATYVIAADLWQLAKRTQDKEMEAKAAMLIIDLVPILIEFAQKVAAPVIIHE